MKRADGAWSELQAHVARIGEILTDVRRSNGRLEPPREVDASDATRLLTARAFRRALSISSNAFDADMSATPVHNVLLELYIAKREYRSVAISSACIAAGVPATTALRYVTALERKGLLQRVKDATDGRRQLLELTVQGEAVVTQVLDGAVDSDRRLGLGRMHFL